MNNFTDIISCVKSDIMMLLFTNAPDKAWLEMHRWIRKVRCRCVRMLNRHRGYSVSWVQMTGFSGNVAHTCVFLFYRLVTTKEKGKKVAMYSIHSNPCNSFEFCVGGRDHFIRIYDKRKIVQVKPIDIQGRCVDVLRRMDTHGRQIILCWNY